MLFASDSKSHMMLFNKYGINYKNTILVFVLFFIGLFIWSLYSKFTITINVKSFITSNTSISIIVSKESSVLIDKNYSEGQYVEKGVSLLEFDTEKDIRALEIAVEKKAKYEAKLRNLLLFEENIRNESNQLSVDNYEAYLMSEIYFIERNKLKEAYNSIVYENELLKMKGEYYVVPHELHESNINKVLAEKEIEQLYFQNILEIEERRKNLLIDIESIDSSSTLLRSRIENAQVKAPISGIIESINKCNIGDYILVGTQLIKIIPIDNELEAVLYVEQKDIPTIDLKQKVVFTFSGIKESKNNRVIGEITRISYDIIQDERGVSYFPVYVKLNNREINTQSGDVFLIVQGMKAISKIIVKEERVINIILSYLGIKEV